VLEGSVFVLLVGIRRRIRQENLVLKKNALNAILIWYGNSSVSDKYSNNILDCVSEMEIESVFLLFENMFPESYLENGR